MNISFIRIILFCKDVSSLSVFYQQHFNFEISEEIKNEWIVLKAGATEIALHKIGAGYSANTLTGANSNVKLVFSIDTDLHVLRETLVSKGVSMQQIRSFENDDTLYCDGEDIEGNVFQLMYKKR